MEDTNGVVMERNNLKEIVEGSMKMPEQEPRRSMWKSRDLDAWMEIIIHLSERASWLCPKLKHNERNVGVFAKDSSTIWRDNDFFSFKSLKNLQTKEAEQIDPFIMKWER